MRKIYKSPEIRKVELRLEEAVLSGCKQLVGAPNGPEMSYCGGYAGQWIGMCKEATS